MKLLWVGMFTLACTGCGDSHEDRINSGVTDIPTTGAKDQSETGNCWLYATTAWAESLSAAPDKARVTDYSTAYLVYWNFYDQILSGKKGMSAVEWTGGSWGSAVELMARYGLAKLHDVTGTTRADADAALAIEAMNAINESLQNGALRTRSARRDPSVVRAELDNAFHLPDDLKTAMNASFGADGSQSFDAGAQAAGDLIAPSNLRVRIPSAPGSPVETTTLDAAIGTRAGDESDPDLRTGSQAWSNVTLAGSESESRDVTLRTFLRRIQRALHDGVPVPVKWCVEDAGKDGYKRFSKAISGVQEDECAHETLIVDYQVRLPSGTILKAGEPASAEEMQQALEPDAEVLFLRMKNSWGLDEATKSGHTDVFVDYIASSVRSCPEKKAKSKDCVEWEFMIDDVTLPPGY